MNQLSPFTSVIVPVHNAEKTVANVVKTLLASELVDEVVCVDDRSTDGSLSILRSFGREIVLVEPGLTHQGGTGEALAEGVWRANGTIVLFVDAGLTTLSEDHLRALVKPLDDGTARAVLGASARESIFSDVIARLTGSRFTSERAYLRADLLRHLLRIPKSELGADVYLNGICKREEVAVVSLVGLRRLGRQGKYARYGAAREYAGEVVGITKTTFRRKLAGYRRVGPRFLVTPQGSHRQGRP